MIEAGLVSRSFRLVTLFVTAATGLANAQAPSLPPETMQAPGSSPSAAPSTDSSHAPAKMPPSLPPIIHYEAVNPGETFAGGDQLAEPRKIAAAVVAIENPSPNMIVDVGSYTG